MRITSKGQVTIPQYIREAAGLLPNTDVDFVLEPTGVRIVKKESGQRPMRGEKLVERLRRSSTHITMSTTELMRLTRGDD
jgi:AbrB family looped-hinge helix DNA binding protein